MIAIVYRAHGETFGLQVELDCNSPQIFIGDQNVSDLINSTDYMAMVRQAKKVAQLDADDERGEFLYAMGCRRA